MKQTQRYVRYGHVGLLVCSSTRLEDVPAAETFLVEDAVSVSKIRMSKEGGREGGRKKKMMFMNRSLSVQYACIVYV